jgi:nucleotide-binding universal stress UspA family protein
MERVVRSSSRPCLVTSRSFQEVSRVLVAYDGGPSCKKAMDYLVKSKLFAGLELHIVTVAGGMNADTALKHLHEAESAAKAAGISSVCQMLTGTPEDQISEYVADNDIDMLVMGAYGHSPLRSMLVGSTTTEMIRPCTIPVMLFR